MLRFLKKYGGPGVLFLIGLGFDMSGFFGTTLLAYAVWGVAFLWAAYLMWSWAIGSGKSEVKHSRRTGVHTRGGSFRSTGTMKIRNQDRSIDSEDTDWETKDTEIE